MIEQTVRPPLNLHEYEAVAQSLLSPAAFAFVAGGSADAVTLRGNRAAFDRWRFLPRVLGGLAECALTTTVLGQEIALPVLIAPMGLHRLVHAEGELASARAAREAGTILLLSLAASTTIEDVGAVAGPWWFQHYLLPDRGRTRDVVARAEAAGASALVVTVDVPGRGRREDNIRHDFTLPDGVTMLNLLASDGAAENGPVPTYAELATWQADIGWSDVDWLASLTRLPLVVKGVLAPEDARAAFAHGAQAIVVSNHGGRQLDSAVASLDALPAIAAAVDGQGELLLDGGVRRGADVLKALALGARAVLLGRPFLYGLAAGGAAGAAHVLELLRAELALDLLLCGRASVGEVDRSLVVPVGPLAG